MEHQSDFVLELLTPEAFLAFSINENNEPIGTDQLEATSKIPKDLVLKDSQQSARDYEVDAIFKGDAPPKSRVLPQDEGPTRNKRAKFNPSRRIEVATIRERGACFRCKVSKASGGCSTEIPCKACVRSKAALTGRKSLRQWMHCVAFSFRCADAFAAALPCTEEKYTNILETSNRIMSQDLEIAFESLTILDIDGISTEVAMLLSSASSAPRPAFDLGILASSSFQRLISPFIADELNQHTRLLVETSLVLGTGVNLTHYAGYTMNELQYLQSFAGTRVLQGLEDALRNPFDPGLAADKGKALFLTLFSVIIAVMHCSQHCARSSEILHARGSTESLVSLQKQLLRIVAHHMIHIANRLNLLREDTARDRIAQDPAHELGRKIHLQWIEDRGSENLPLDSPQGNPESPRRPRRALIADKSKTLLPLEQCQICKQMKRWINLQHGKCLECRCKAKTSELPSHLLHLKKIIDRRDSLSFLSDDDDDDDDDVLSQASQEFDLYQADEVIPQPFEPYGYETRATIGSDGHLQAGIAVTESMTVPIWEQCVWCDAASGADIMCDTCKAAQATQVEHTNFPLDEWFAF